MSSNRFPERYSSSLPQWLQNRLRSSVYPKAGDVSTNEGTVKRVISRDTIIITLEDDSEMEIKLMNVNNATEPYAWEAKQMLHQMLVDQKVYIVSVRELQPQRLLADVYLLSGYSATELLIRYGLATLRSCLYVPKKEFKHLTQVQNVAAAAKMGIWGTAESLDYKMVKGNSLKKVYVKKFGATQMLMKYGLPSLQHCPFIWKKGFKKEDRVQNVTTVQKMVTWAISENLKHRTVNCSSPVTLNIKELLCKPIECIIYCIKGVDSIHIIKIPEHFCIEVTVSGGQTVLNASKLKRKAMKYFLHKCVTMELKNFDICTNKFWGKITEPKLSELDAVLCNSTNAIKVTATVVEVFNGNSFTLRIRNKIVNNVFLSYINFPCKCSSMRNLCRRTIQNLKILSLYYSQSLRLEARELLRKQLLHRTVEVIVDYWDRPKGIYCTMNMLGINIGKWLVELGLAYVDDKYSEFAPKELIIAEQKAADCHFGMYATSRPQELHVNVAWCMDNVMQLWETLQKKKQCSTTVVVEQVLSPSYIILFSFELRWLFSFSLIDFEEVRHTNPGFTKNTWKNIVTELISDMCLQQEVSITVSSIDCNGVFHGNLKKTGCNLRRLLLQKILKKKKFTKRRFQLCKKTRRRIVDHPYQRGIKRTSVQNAAFMRRLKQHLRRDVKTLVSLLPMSPYYAKDKRMKKNKEKIAAAQKKAQEQNRKKIEKREEKKRKQERIMKKKEQKQRKDELTKKKLKAKKKKEGKKTNVQKEKKEKIKKATLYETENVLSGMVINLNWEEIFKNRKNSTVALHWCCL